MDPGPGPGSAGRRFSCSPLNAHLKGPGLLTYFCALANSPSRKDFFEHLYRTKSRLVIFSVERRDLLNFAHRACEVVLTHGSWSRVTVENSTVFRSCYVKGFSRYVSVGCAPQNVQRKYIYHASMAILSLKTRSYTLIPQSQPLQRGGLPMRASAHRKGSATPLHVGVSHMCKCYPRSRGQFCQDSQIPTTCVCVCVCVCENQ